MPASVVLTMVPASPTTKPVILTAQEMVEFLVQMPNLELRFQVHLIVVFRPQSVARLRTVLTHHDNRGLHRSQAGQNQIEQNEWIRIERSGSEQNGIRSDPHKDNSAKRDQKFPTAAKFGDPVGESLAKREFPFELFNDVARKNLMLFQAFDDFLVQRGKFADLVFQNLLYVILPKLA